MNPIDLKSYAPAIGELLLRKSITAAPLQWHVWPDRASMTKLTATKLHDLFDPKTVANDDAARCVFAGLSLLCGFGAAVEKVCGALSSKEALYWRAIAFRQTEKADRAATLFHQMDGHAIYDELGREALELIGLGSGKQLGKVRKVLEQNGTWDPFAFIDLFENARAGEISDHAINVTCRIQQLEAQLLLQYCYYAAIGAVECPT